MNKTMTAIVAGLLILTANDIQAWDHDEHRQLADSVYQYSVRCFQSERDDTSSAGEEERCISLKDVSHGAESFGQLCALAAADDFASDRFHLRGKSILEQLRCLEAEQVTAAWNEVATDKGSSDSAGKNGYFHESPNLRTNNVVCAYLLNHLIALRIASGWEGPGLSDEEALPAALRWEAAAQGYLADAFSSGHMLVPMSGLLARLQRRNNVETHNYFRNQGVYVINSRGDVWQAFGDNVLHWYAPTYRAVFKACRSSLWEVLVGYCVVRGRKIPSDAYRWLDSIAPGMAPEELVSSWLVDGDGPDYYTAIRMPTLLLLPMPVAASWSRRTASQDEHGIRRRHHFPQLSEPGFHDPDIDGIDTEFLYSIDAMPDWLLPPPFTGTHPVAPDSLVKHQPDWASVRWIQNRWAPPSYKGLLLHFGGQVTSGNGERQLGGLLGIGYGIWDDLIVLRNVSFSAAIMPSVYEPERTLLVPNIGGGLALGNGRLRALRVEGGFAVGLGSDYDETGGMLSLGIDSRPWPLKVTNAGITLRLKYQWFYFERLLKGPSLEVLVH
ncbi:MAG: hypothetical protein JSU74_00060 [Candidatus Zixiibacteriota bacterium]|nr:MAG: hypothetical protein JSU74_00060 [candidate division Zixibacteria bacterium]